jgi:hypothetical protein
MFILTIKGLEDEGAYAVEREDGEKVLLLFEESDDAVRYALMLEDDDENPEMDVIEVDDRIAIKTCEMYNYEYNIITQDDIVIPPRKSD